MLHDSCAPGIHNSIESLQGDVACLADDAMLTHVADQRGAMNLLQMEFAQRQ